MEGNFNAHRALSSVFGYIYHEKNPTLLAFNRRWGWGDESGFAFLRAEREIHLFNARHRVTHSQA